MNFLLPALGLLALASTPFSACLGQDASDSQDEILEHANKSWTGDLDGMTKRGFVRILTVHNPLFFQFEGASKRGLVEEWGKAFEAHLAEEIGRVRSPTVVLIPVARDELLPGLIEGRGDLVMGNLTITPERQKLVDFGPPIHTDISELVVTGPAAQGVASFDDLVQTGVYVRRSSSYFEHLQGLNAERSAQGKPPIPITEADENLEDYDLLDMVNAGILEAVIVDSHKAALWEQVFDRIEVHRDLVVNSGSRIAWALRKGSPELMRSISAFSAKVKKGSLLGNVLIERYLGDAEWLENALASEDRERYEETIEIIQRYAARYDFDWLIIAAQAYQESRLDQDKRSPAGAIGVMQLLPSTAADAAVGIPDITNLENNIHAGVKYLHWLRETYYSDASIAPLDRALFSFAAYNAGPGNMQKARRRARRLGFDPNRWFGNVEIGMFRAVSGEPASYVRNIYKYYVTYQGLERSRRAREKALASRGRPDRITDCVGLPCQETRGSIGTLEPLREIRG
jgi:membrane-bound lytic murein transglycosylase MltF